MGNESQAILPFQDFADGLPPPKRPELWVIESFTGCVRVETSKGAIED
jgi:hypothetical protein